MVTKQDDSDIMEIIDTYSKEYAEDTIVDEFRLNEMLLKIPGIKGKWVTYFSINQAKLYKLTKEAENLIEEAVPVIQQKRETEGHNVTKKGAEMIVKNTKKYKELSDKISKLKVLDQYFQRSLGMIQYINQDLRNFIDSKKMDEM